MIRRLKWKYLALIFVFTLASVLMQMLYANFKHEQQMQQRIVSLGADAQLYFNDLINGLRDKYLSIALHYSNEPVLKALFAQRNHQGLLNYAAADYESMRLLDPNLHIMHFIDQHNRTLLRLHQPTLFNDDLTNLRPIVRDVNATQRALQGFEVGKNGITYRITTPLIDRQGVHFGVIEFGIMPNYFVEHLVKRFAVESMILVRSDSLGTLQQNHDFAQLNGYSIIQLTPFFEQIVNQVDLTQQNQIIEHQGKSYLILSNLNQQSHHGEVISKVIIASDITAMITENKQSLVKEAILNLMVLLFLLAMIYAMFSRYTHALENSYETIQALHLQSSQLKNQANTDELTGLYNRRFFNESLQKIVEYGKTGSLLFFDIDHFKHLNDAHGHQAGDQVLVELAQMMLNFFRQDDLIVRWGGEEFAVFINDMNEKDAYQKAERFRHFVETSSSVHQPFAFTISGGVTQLNQGDNLDEVFKRADERLYAAKEHGRNQVVAQFYKTTRPGDKEV